MSRKQSDPIPPEIKPSEAKCFYALRIYRRKLGQELTVEDFRNRRRWGTQALKSTRCERPPQTADGAREILRRKGLAP